MLDSEALEKYDKQGCKKSLCFLLLSPFKFTSTIVILYKCRSNHVITLLLHGFHHTWHKTPNPMAE